MSTVPRIQHHMWKCGHCGGRGQELLPAGRWLRALREAEGFTLRELAKRLDISPAYLSDQERGNRKPGLALLLWASRVVGIDLVRRETR